MQAVLVMFRSDGERRSFSITRDVTVIGRREDADLRIPLGDISRKHARLIREPDGMRLEDLGSSNGTYLNGQRIEREAMLQAGDSIQVGPVVFVLQLDGYPQDEELHPITSESATGAAMFGAADAGAVTGDDLMDLEPLPAGDAHGGDPLADEDPTLGGGGQAYEQGGEGQFDELQPLGEEAPLEDVALEDVALEEVALDDAADGAAGPATAGAAAPIPLHDDDDLGGAPAGEALALTDDEPLQPTEDQPMALADEPLALADDDDALALAPAGGPATAPAAGGHDPIPLDLDDAPLELADDPGAGAAGTGGPEPLALGDDAALELLAEDPQSTPPHGDPIPLDLDEQPGQAKR